MVTRCTYGVCPLNLGCTGYSSDPQHGRAVKVDTSWSSSVPSAVLALYVPGSGHCLLHFGLRKVSCSGGYVHVLTFFKAPLPFDHVPSPCVLPCTALGQHTLECWIVGHHVDVGRVHVSSICIPPRAPGGGVSHTVTELFPLFWLSHRVDILLHPYRRCRWIVCHVGGWHSVHLAVRLANDRCGGPQRSFLCGLPNVSVFLTLLFYAPRCFGGLCIFSCPCSTLIHCGSSRVSGFFSAAVFEYLFGIRLGTLTYDDLIVRLWPTPPSHFHCVPLTVHFSLLVAIAKWTRRWQPIWVPCESLCEEWEQEVHTSDDQLQERECHRQDPSIWS